MTEKTAAPGWYPTDNGERWWDGTAWGNQIRDANGVVTELVTAPTKTPSAPWGPIAYIVVGLVGSFLGGVLFIVGADQAEDAMIILGWLVMTVATIFFLIGVIAQGVVLGMRTLKKD